MRTDELFYDLFKLSPESLFELVKLEMKGQYKFESITVKDTERRIDGFAWSVDGRGPKIFLEVQGYSEPKIYWKTFREVSSYYESGSDTKPFVIIILFIDKEFDPISVPLCCNEPNRLVRAYLPDCLKTMENKASALTVLKPLVFNKKKELPDAVKKWTNELKSIEDISQSDYNRMIELLEYALLQRFKNLTIEEIIAMIELTPLEKTAAGQQLIQMGKKEGIKEGKEEGIKEGLERGEVIGEIRMLQKMMQRPISLKEELIKTNDTELAKILDSLMAEWNKM